MLKFDYTSALIVSFFELLNGEVLARFCLEILGKFARRGNNRKKRPGVILKVASSESISETTFEFPGWKERT